MSKDQTKSQRLKPRKGHEERLATVLSRRELAGEQATADAREQVLSAAQRRAEGSELSIESLVERDLGFLRSSGYPGEECFEPYELELIASGELSEERLGHAETCTGCESLLSALAPRPEKVEEIVQEVRKLTGERSTGATGEPSSTPQKRKSRRPLVFVREALAVTLPLALAIFLGALLHRWPESSRTDTAWNGPLLAVALVLMIGMSVAFAALLAKTRYLGRLLRDSGGALVGGFTGAAFLVVLVGFLPLDDATDSGDLLRWTEEELLEETAEGLARTWLATGEYPSLADSTGFVTVQTASTGAEQARYTATAHRLEGTVEAQLSGGSGALYFRHQERPGVEPAVEKRAQLVIGRISKTTDSSILLEERNGKEHTLRLPENSDFQEGQELLAVLEPDSETVRAVYALDLEEPPR